MTEPLPEAVSPETLTLALRRSGARARSAGPVSARSKN
jgi:hypothetical protein